MHQGRQNGLNTGASDARRGQSYNPHPKGRAVYGAMPGPKPGC